MTMPMRKTASVIPIMAAGDMNVQWVSRLDLVEFFEKFPGFKLAIVLCLQSLNVRVNAFLIGSTEQLLSSTVQSVVFWISTVCNSSAENTWSMVRM
jgi:hypothetical protein